MPKRKDISGIILYCLILLFIYPLSPIVFKEIMLLKEPRLICPARIKSAEFIRRDTMGSGNFGARRSNGRRHKGLDILGCIDEPVFAAKSGFVKTGEVPRGMGKYVKICHLDGFSTTYGHLNSVEVDNGSWVWQGQKIGSIGNTGNADNPSIKPHLHFELRRGGTACDPLPYIAENKTREGG